MRKLKLEITELVVSSFEIPDGLMERGTVDGRATPRPSQLGTCYDSCELSCASCPATCGGILCSYEVTQCGETYYTIEAVTLCASTGPFWCPTTMGSY